MVKYRARDTIWHKLILWQLNLTSDFVPLYLEADQSSLLTDSFSIGKQPEAHQATGLDEEWTRDRSVVGQVAWTPPPALCHLLSPRLQPGIPGEDP